MIYNMDILKQIEAVFATWVVVATYKTPAMLVGDTSIGEMFLTKIIRKKLQWAGIDAILPDHLCLILAIYAESPGYIQLMVKELLTNINEHNGPIEHGYTITPDDFARVFEKFPIVSYYEDIAEKYSKAWDNQKVKSENGSDYNMVDTKEYWQEIKFKNV